MRRIALLPFLMLPSVSFAQDATTVTLPTADVAHAVVYLRNGGTRMEADALADQIMKAAQADMAKQQAAKMPPPEK